MNDPSTRVSLLIRLRDANDNDAWTEFERRYADLIRRMGRRCRLQPADCEDVRQEVMVRLTDSMSRFEYDPDRGTFRGWLKTVVINAIRDKARQNRARPTVPLDETPLSSDAALDQVWESEWRRHHVRLAMESIRMEFSHADRIAFERYAVQGLDARATAESLDMSVDQVYQAKSRILRRVTTLIEEQMLDEGELS